MIYLDNAATTKPSKAAIAAAEEAFCTFGNPSSLHRLGLAAEKLVKKSREELAVVLHTAPANILFTSGGTESNNLAILGYCRANAKRGKHVITTRIEHPSVLSAFAALEKEGFSVTRLGVDSEGKISLEEFSDALSEDTILVSVMAANNEVGTIQPVSELKPIMREKAKKAALHVDAVQAFGKIPLYPEKWGIDLMSVSAHKIHGMKGCGALYWKNVRLESLQYGGGQQGGMRSGTENVPGIAAFGAAVAEIPKNNQDILKTRAALKQKIAEQIDRVVFHGSDTEQTGYLLNASFLGVRAEVLLHMLETKEIYVSTGSACSSHKPSPSHVLTAMGCSPKEIEGAIRMSFSEPLSEDEIDEVTGALTEAVAEIRKFVR